MKTIKLSDFEKEIITFVEGNSRFVHGITDNFGHEYAVIFDLPMNEDRDHIAADTEWKEAEDLMALVNVKFPEFLACVGDDGEAAMFKVYEEIEATNFIILKAIQSSIIENDEPSEGVSLATEMAECNEYGMLLVFGTEEQAKEYMNEDEIEGVVVQLPTSISTLKTRLPEAIKTQEQAEAFLKELSDNKEVFHPEDDATDIEFDGIVVTQRQRLQLNKLMNDIYNIDGNNGDHANPKFDPCEFIIKLNGNFMEDDSIDEPVVIGVQGLKVRVMGTSEDQPVGTQANFILKHIINTQSESMVTIGAQLAIDEERELEHVRDLAFQITYHPRKDYVRFNPALDAWILEVSF